MTAAAPTDLLHTHPELYAEYLPANSGVTDFVLGAISKFSPAATQVLDVGCGLGREVAALSTAGYNCTGLDASIDMLRAAQRTHPGLPFEIADQRQLETSAHDVVLSLGSALLHNKSLVDLRRTLHGMASSLRPGGLLIIESRNGGYWSTKEGRQALAEVHHEYLELSTGESLTASLCYRLDLSRQLLLREYRWRLPDGRLVDELLDQLLILPGHLIAELANAGFQTLSAFSLPAAADGSWVSHWPANDALSGPRLHVIAQRDLLRGPAQSLIPQERA